MADHQIEPKLEVLPEAEVSNIDEPELICLGKYANHIYVETPNGPAAFNIRKLPTQRWQRCSRSGCTAMTLNTRPKRVSKTRKKKK